MPFRPSADKLCLSDADGRGDLEALVSRTDHALLITSLWYLRDVDLQTMQLTGLTRDGCYLVQDGNVTGATGNFRFNFCDDDGVLNDTLELYFRVCAEVRDGNSLIARIEQTDEQELYCWDSDIVESDGGDVDFDLTVYRLAQTEASVFNIADSLYWAWRFWNNNTANSPVMDRAVTVYWQEAKGAKGSFYSDDRTTMVIADDPSSADEWDDSVIMHE